MIFQRLTVYTSAVKQQFAFYKEQLSLPCELRSGKELMVNVGRSKLHFVEKKSANEDPYHFAFNIEPAALPAALAHLQYKNIELLPVQGNHLIDFPHWNAKSIYFLDADKNIVEFIGHYDLAGENASADFNASQLKSISEVGIVVKDSAGFIHTIQQQTKLPIWKSYGAEFNALGDEEGLLIVSQQPRNWFPTNRSAQPLPMKVYVQQEGKNFDYDETCFYFNAS